ncbi:MAG TPA: hypothetical protein VFV10_17780 [Gammaproteobacteria bacterium]|nr:hypothetical protein [Gammaproteobacteria bacterium]
MPSTAKAPPSKPAPPRSSTAARVSPPVRAGASYASVSEHILLEGDDSFEQRSTGPLTEQKRLALRDRLRSREIRLVLYAEGFLRLDEWRRGKRIRAHRIDMRYVDPLPVIERWRATRWLKAGLLLGVAAAGAGAIARVAPDLADFPTLRLYAVAAAALLAAAALSALAAYVYRTGESATFVTRHGRAPVLRLTAGLGRIRRCRALLPELRDAIADAFENVSDDTRTFLRHEMREHYRLRTDGILNDEDCSDSTGRILARFDTRG